MHGEVTYSLPMPQITSLMRPEDSSVMSRRYRSDYLMWVGPVLGQILEF